jgi:protein-tyrosine phosphatase
MVTRHSFRHIRVVRAYAWSIACAVACAPAEDPALVPPGPPPVDGACPAGRAVLAGEADNARDLGGVPLATGEHTACGQLFRGAHLAGLGARGCEDLAALGVRRVVDLRTTSEWQRAPDADCGLPVVHAPLPIPYDLSPSDYIASLNARASMRVVTAELARGEPLYFHCVYGRDRTGVVAAVLLRALGASRDEVMRDYLLTEAAGLHVAPESLEATLDELERRGGVEAYLSGLGVTTATLADWRARWITSD